MDKCPKECPKCGAPLRPAYERYYECGTTDIGAFRQSVACLERQVAALTAQLAEEQKYAAFGRKVLDDFIDGDFECDVDGGNIQDWALEFGLFRKELYDPKVHGHAGFEDFGEGDEVYLVNDGATLAASQAGGGDAD